MNNDRYHFKLGDFDCLAIFDAGHYTHNAGGIFPDVPYPLLQAENVDPDHINVAIICLAVNTGTDWVLLDTGMGFMEEDARLVQILEEENIEPRHIIITHLDSDHYAGLINRDQTLAFPNADVHIYREAWALFTSDAFYEGNDTYDRREHLLLIESQVKLVECDEEILPGFSMMPLPGHREYHTGIEVESNSEKLLFAGDVVGHPLHIKHLDWHCSYDSNHEMARESRIKFAQMTADSGSLVLVYHFEFPGLGHIVQDGDGWKWQPLEI